MKEDAKKTVKNDSNETATTSRQYYTLPIPKINLRNTSFTPILIGLLLVASYLLGMLTTKVQYLEKNGGTTVQQQNQAAVGAQQAPQEPAPVDAEVAAKLVNENDAPLPSLGDEKSKVTIVEFSDFQCPFCKRFFDDAYKQIKTDYIDTGKVHYTFRHYPLPFHANAQKAGEAAECANEQNGFWAYHDVLFNNQTSWENLAAADANTKFGEYATQAGLDGTALVTCVESGKYAQKVQDDMNVGSQAGVSGTPSIFVNGRIIVGAMPYAEFKKVIDEELAK